MKREQRNSLILATALLAVLGAAFLAQRFLLRGLDGPEAWAVVQVGSRELRRLVKAAPKINVGERNGSMTPIGKRRR